MTRDYFLPIVADAGAQLGGTRTCAATCPAMHLHQLRSMPLLHTPPVVAPLVSSLQAPICRLWPPPILICRGWLWRPPERLRADQAPDRGGRRWR